MPPVGTTPDLRLDERDARDRYVDHHLSRSGDQIRRLARNQHLGTSEPRRPHHSHVNRSPALTLSDTGAEKSSTSTAVEVKLISAGTGGSKVVAEPATGFAGFRAPIS
ncbi:hypothetical protein ACFQX6_21980 [Streptosporangium lutulentum]